MVCRSPRLGPSPSPSPLAATLCPKFRAKASTLTRRAEGALNREQTVFGVADALSCPGSTRCIHSISGAPMPSSSLSPSTTLVSASRSVCEDAWLRRACRAASSAVYRLLDLTAPAAQSTLSVCDGAGLPAGACERGCGSVSPSTGAGVAGSDAPLSCSTPGCSCACVTPRVHVAAAGNDSGAVLLVGDGCCFAPRLVRMVDAICEMLTPSYSTA
jgi:hypothetical protein